MLWVLIRSVSRGTSNEYPQHMFLQRTGGNYPIIITKNSLTVPLLKFYSISKLLEQLMVK